MRTQVQTVSLAEGGEELRVAPQAEPLAACAFRWPPGWAAAAPPWAPPAPFRIAPLLSLQGPDGELQLGVARLGVEVDLRALCTDYLGVPGVARWRGPSTVEVEHPSAAWRVIGAGAAIFLLRAVGEAREFVDAAATSFRPLGAPHPTAEPMVPFECGAYTGVRLAAWALEPVRGLRHGVAGLTLRSADLEGRPLGAIHLRVIDRRVHVGADPAHALAEIAELWEADGAAGWRVESTPAGPVEQAVGGAQATPVECWRALRQRGPALVGLAGRWPRESAVPRLNGRRHAQLLLLG